MRSCRGVVPRVRPPVRRVPRRRRRPSCAVSRARVRGSAGRRRSSRRRRRRTWSRTASEELAGDPSSSSFDDDPGVSSSLADASAHTRLLTRYLAASTDTPRVEDGAHRLGRQSTAAIRPTAVDLTARDSVMRGNASRCLRPSRGFRPPTAGALLAAHPDGASDAISPHLFERARSPAMTAGALAGEINNPQTRAIFFERECRLLGCRGFANWH